MLSGCLSRPRLMLCCCRLLTRRYVSFSETSGLSINYKIFSIFRCQIRQMVNSDNRFMASHAGDWPAPACYPKCKGGAVSSHGEAPNIEAARRRDAACTGSRGGRQPNIATMTLLVGNGHVKFGPVIS